MMNKVVLLLNLLFLINNAVSANESEIDAAIALKPNIENGQKVFEICSHCHSKRASDYHFGISRRHVNGFYPVLAGQHKDVIIKQLFDIRSGNRDNPQMYPFTLQKFIGGLQDIADVAGYIAQLPLAEKSNNIGLGYDLELGKRLYEENCTKCHGENGEGDNKNLYPKLQGQHYNYMLRQFRWIKEGRRRNADEEMQKQIDNFSYREMQAVIDYTSRLEKTKR